MYTSLRRYHYVFLFLKNKEVSQYIVIYLKTIMCFDFFFKVYYTELIKSFKMKNYRYAFITAVVV